MPTKIAIIGAGPAGLTLARLLHVGKSTSDVTIFERDASPTSRPEQGGTLDLHAETGLAAIKACNLWDEFSRYARYDGSEMMICDKWATKLVHIKGSKDINRPEIDRYRLREILLTGVPEHWIRWSMHLREVAEDRTLRFHGPERGNDVIEGPFDLIIGADGAWSKVRDLLNPSVRPSYAGVSGYELEIPKPAETCPHVDRFAGQGGMISLAHKRLLNCQRMGNGSLKVRTWFACPENEARDTLEKLGKKSTFERTLAKYEQLGWSPTMLELLRRADISTMRHWTLYELPVGHRWTHKPGFTLLGDAASLATPFSGEGVNKAMEDALDLASSILESEKFDSSLDQAILEYETRLHPRSEKLQRVTMSNKRAMFGSDSPVDLIPLMVRTLASESPSMIIRMLGTKPVTTMLWAVVWVKQRVQWAIQALS